MTPFRPRNCCRLCEAPLPERSDGAGRPRAYCPGGCKRVSDALWRLVDALDRAAPGSLAGVRRAIVAEVLNRLPLDPAMLRERARGQARDADGRFTADCPAANYLSLDPDQRGDHAS